MVENLFRYWAAYGWVRPSVTGGKRKTVGNGLKLAENIAVERISEKEGIDLTFTDVRLFCRRHDIPFCECSDVNDGDVVQFFSRLDPDFVINMGRRLLRKDILAVPRLGIINAHTGRLPRFRGFAPVEWSVLLGDDVGASFHLIDEGVDTGDILRWCPVDGSQVRSMDELRILLIENVVMFFARLIERCDDRDFCGTRQAVEEGSQYFSMHPALLKIVEDKLGRNVSGK